NSNTVLDLGTRPDTAGRPVAVLQLAPFSPRTGNFFDPSDVYLVRVGEPLGSIYGYQVAGLWQVGDQCYLTNTVECTPGEYKIVDQLTVDTNSTPDGIPDVADGKITAADRVILGRGEPKFYGGF